MPLIDFFGVLIDFILHLSYENKKRDYEKDIYSIFNGFSFICNDG